MKRHAQAVVDELERRGYRFDRCNSKGLHVYAKDGAEVVVKPSCDEFQARAILKKLGVADGHTKRNVSQVRDRQAAERDRARREVARLEREREAIVARKRRAFGGIAAQMTEGEVRAIERRIEEIDREVRRLQALMTDVPETAAHRGSGTVHHRAGER